MFVLMASIILAVHVVTGASNNLVLVIAKIWKYFQTEPFGKEKRNHKDCWHDTIAEHF